MEDHWVNNTLLYVIFIVMKEFFRTDGVNQNYKTYQVIRHQQDLHIMRTGLALAQLEYSGMASIGFNTEIIKMNTPSKYLVQIKTNYNENIKQLKLGFFILFIYEQNQEKYIDLVHASKYFFYNFFIDFISQGEYQNNDRKKQDFSQITETDIRLKQLSIFNCTEELQNLEIRTFLTSFVVKNQAQQWGKMAWNQIQLDIKANINQGLDLKVSLVSRNKQFQSVKCFILLINMNRQTLYTEQKIQITFFQDDQRPNQQNKQIGIINQYKNYYLQELKQQKICFLGIQSLKINVKDSIQKLNFSLIYQMENQTALIQANSSTNKQKISTIINKLCIIQARSHKQIISQKQNKNQQNGIISQKQKIYQNENQFHNKSSNLKNQTNKYSSKSLMLFNTDFVPIVGSGGGCGMGFYKDAATNNCTACSLWKTTLCVDCNSTHGCIVCTTNYKGDGWGNCMCDPASVSFVPFCTSCSSPGICDYCQRGNYLAGPTSCLPCPNTTIYCDLCVSAVQCVRCDPGYTLDTTTQPGLTICLYCKDYISNCTTTGCLNITICNLCQVGFYIQPISPGINTCLNCTLNITNCLECTAANFCTLCRNNKYFVDSIVDGMMTIITKNCTLCSMAIINCDTCTSKTACTACISGYTWNTTACQCTPSFFNLTNCTLCINSSYCYGCVLNAILLSDGRCIFCQPTDVHPNCTACTNLSLCTNCQPTYVLDLLTDPLNITCTLCIIAIPGCQPLNCLTQSYCTGCYDTHYLNQSNTSYQICTFCNVSLGTPCLTCDNQIKCTLCSYGYYLKDFASLNSSTICQLCRIPISNCLGCTDQNNCVQCSRGYITYFTAMFNQTICQACHYFYLNCKQCNTSSCTVCQPPFVFSNNSLCEDCEAGYEKINGYCFKYPGCLTTSIVNGVQICISCAYFLNFHLDTNTNTCVCNTGFKEYYTLGHLMSCITVCANGILSYPLEQCDDGNVRTGDGCDNYCKVEPYFQCNVASPTQCVLVYDFKILLFNYAYRVVGQHKGILSYTIMPPQIGLKKMNWKQLIKLNFSMTAVDNLSLEYSYDQNSGQLQIHFTYNQELQDVYLFANITFDPSLVLSNPSTLYRTDKLNGINAPLELQSLSFLKHYKTIDFISLFFICVILFQFYMGSYSHKMIGLETIQVIQLIYFVRMLSDSTSINVLGSLNYLKYCTTGYENSQILLGTSQNITQASTKVSKEFVSVKFDKYFFQNVNFSLFIIGLVLTIYIITLIVKHYRRQAYIEIFDGPTKNVFLESKRSAQWVYDHFVFPYIMMLGGAIFFNSLSYLQVLQSSSSPIQPTSKVQIISFSAHMVFIFIYFGMFCYQINISLQQFQENQTTIKNKGIKQKSFLQKIQIDQKNPDRRNYHPLYICIYLLSYLTIWIVLSFQIFAPQFTYQFQVFLGINIIYFVIILKFKPYFQEINSHNNFLIFNHGAVIVFLIDCIYFKIQNTKNNQTFLVSMYGMISLLSLITLGGFVRLFFQAKFRKFMDFKNKKIEQIQVLKQNIQQHILNQNIPNKVYKNQPKLSRKQRLLTQKNSYLFSNQMKQFKHKYRHEYLQHIDQMRKQNKKIVDIQNNEFFIQKIRQDYAKKRNQMLFGKNQKKLKRFDQNEVCLME